MKLLAFDTSTERLSIAVSRDDGAAAGLWQYQGAGGAQASTDLIANVLRLMEQAGLALGALDAICFGCGPGSFTGLRTACAVAQGLAFGAQVPVLPINTLLAVAETARHSHLAHAQQGQVLALLDARMDEVYQACYAFDCRNGGLRWRELQPPRVGKPEALAEHAQALAGPLTAAAGNAFAAYGDRLAGLEVALPRIACGPDACALLRLAPQLLADGQAVPAAQALPLYVRDKVAQTTAERAALRAAQPVSAAVPAGSAAP